MDAGTTCTSANATPEANHYLDHLAAVNQDREVTATEDIVNQNGALLAPRAPVSTRPPPAVSRCTN